MSVETVAKRYTRTVNQTGNSLTVGIPKEYIDALNLSKGDQVEVSFDEQKGEVVMKKVNRLPEGVRPDVMRAMNRAINKYDDALRNLRDR